MPNSSDLSQGAAERAGYIHGLPESTQADFLSGRMGFAMGFDNTNQIMVDLWSEGFQPRDIPAASAADDLGRYCQAREQLAAFLFRYNAYKGYVSTQRADLGTFSDSAAAASYAKDALSWANAAGLVNGTSDGRLNPSGGATRGQAAAILHRFCVSIGR